MKKTEKVTKKKTASQMHDGVIGVDAVDLLTEDHKAVKAIFKKHRSLVESGGSKKEKLALVKEACNALAVHAQIEEEIFYPAMQKVVESSTLAEAFVEHDCAKDLIQQLEEMNDEDTLFDAKFIVLGELVKHHIEEEESDIFPEARKSKIDLHEIGAEMELLKATLEAEPPFPDRPILREEAPSYI